MSALALFSSLLKNKAVTILCAVFFFFYCLPHTGLYDELYAHYSLTLFITENSVTVILGTEVNNTKFLLQWSLGIISYCPFNNHGGWGWSKFLVFYRE